MAVGDVQWPTWFQKVCNGIAFAYAAATLAWGAACVIEDTYACAASPSTAPAIVTRIKMATQIMADIASFPLFTLPRWTTYPIGFLTYGIWGSSLIQLQSNYYATLTPGWGDAVDPAVTGAIGVCQLIGYAFLVWQQGGSTLQIFTNIVIDIGEAFEWIPQLGKYWSVSKPLVPLIEGCAYGVVAEYTTINAITSLRGSS